MVCDTTDNDGTDSPEHLQHLSCWCSQPQWHDLGTVGRRVGNENAPWDAFQDLGHKEYRIAVGEIEDEDEAVQEHEAADGRPTITDPTGDGASNKDTNEGADRATALEC